MTVLKTVVAGLALTNVGYFLWTHGIGGSTPPINKEANAGGASLRMAGEPAASPALASTPSLTMAPRAGGPATGGTVPAGTPGAASTGTEPAAAAPSPSVSATASSAGTGASPNGARCVSVGPFKDITDAAHAAATLRGGGYNPRQRGAEGDIWAGIWVFLPLPSSKVAADQMRAKLKAGGIEDALEMPGPNDVPVLSLGLYSESKRAQGRVVQAQSLGLNPGLADRKRTGNVYWIDIDLKPTDGSLNPADLQTDTGAHSAHLEVKACPGGAP